MYPIPANATRIRYLESTGTQYIDTGVGATASTQVDVSFSLAQSFQYENGKFIFGAYSDSGRCYYSVAIPSGTELRIPQAGGPEPNRFVNISAATGIGNVKTLSYKPGAIYLDNVLVSNDTALTDSPVDIFVFARKRNGSADNLTGGIRIYWLKIYSGSTLVRSFVPVRVGSVGYLFDRVSGQLFGNAGTGDFVLGPDTFSQGVVPTRMMPMGVRKRPYDAEVDYVESTGLNTGPWIDTGVVPNNSTRWEIDVEYGLSSVVYMGVDATQKFRIATRLGGNMDMQFALGSVYVAIKPSNLAGRHSVYLDASAKRCGVDTATANINGSYSLTGAPLFLFGANNGSGGVATKRESKIYSCQISQSGVLVRDFVPVRIGTVGYLYDKVSKQLFGNAGTGSFTLGPDK